MHMGNNNINAKHEMIGKLLEEVTEERDLGVIMQNDLKCRSQCIKAVKTANIGLGMIKRTFSVGTGQVADTAFRRTAFRRTAFHRRGVSPHV